MCFTGAIAPEVCHYETRTARKDYKCCECGVMIGRGEKYEHVWGVWGGDPGTYRTCGACVERRKIITDYEHSVGCDGTEAIPPFGTLMDEWRDFQNREHLFQTMQSPDDFQYLEDFI